MPLRNSRRPLLVWGLSLSAIVFLGLAVARRDAPRSPALRGAHPEVRLESRPDFPGEAQEYFLAKRLPTGKEGQGASIPELYQAALARLRDMPRHSLVSGRTVDARAAAKAALGTWTPLGPGNIGGRTRALLIDPRDPDVLYAAGSSGGVFKSTDAGGSWVPVEDLMANLAVNALAFDPRNPDVLYAGTGEGYFNQNSVQGAGIFRSTDAGRSWARLAATARGDFHFVNDLLVSPVSSSRLYASTRTGVWRSLDRGASWQRVLDPKVGGGCFDLALRTVGRNDVLFAACGTRAQGTVYRNTQAQGPAGAWQAVLRERGMGRTTLAIAPSDPEVIYALAASIAPGPYRLGLHALYRSERGGEKGSFIPRLRNTSRQKLSTLLLTNPLFANAEACGLGPDLFANLGWFANTLAVDPEDPDRVWAGGIDLFRSDNGGRTFGLASNWWDLGAANFVHADQHVLAFDPRYDGRTRPVLYVGNDGGVFRTDNARAATYSTVCDPSRGRIRFRALNHGYSVTQFYHGAPYPDGEAYLAGAQDNGVVRGRDATGTEGWEYVVLGDGGYVAIDPTDPDILYMENAGPSLVKSTDGGRTALPAMRGIDEPPPNFLFIVPFTLDPSDPKRLWLGGSRLWRTTDGAASWTAASARLAGSRPRVSAIAVAPGDPDTVLAGTDQGFIHRTSAALAATADSEWPAAKPRDGFVSSLAFDPEDPSVAYATYATFGGTHVWKTVDGGAFWRPLDGSGAGALPNLPAHALVVDPRDRRRLYLGTDLGVFVSLDGGAHWAAENTGFAHVLTESLTLLQKGDGTVTLFAFTRGRGAWKVDVAR